MPSIDGRSKQGTPDKGEGSFPGGESRRSISNRAPKACSALGFAARSARSRSPPFAPLRSRSISSGSRHDVLPLRPPSPRRVPSLGRLRYRGAPLSGGGNRRSIPDRAPKARSALGFAAARPLSRSLAFPPDSRSMARIMTPRRFVRPSPRQVSSIERRRYWARAAGRWRDSIPKVLSEPPRADARSALRLCRPRPLSFAPLAFPLDPSIDGSHHDAPPLRPPFASSSIQSRKATILGRPAVSCGQTT